MNPKLYYFRSSLKRNVMKISKVLSMLLITGIVVLYCVPAHAQFITIARKIKGMHTSSADVATVILDAKTPGVYKAIIDTLTANPKFKITQRDNGRHLVEFTKETYKISMQVDSLDVNLSQITVSATSSDKEAPRSSSMAVDAIERVCQKLGIKCTVKD
jgi:hypothetical protein